MKASGDLWLVQDESPRQLSQLHWNESFRHDKEKLLAVHKKVLRNAGCFVSFGTKWKVLVAASERISKCECKVRPAG